MSNHRYCKSIYGSSPDGLIVEFRQNPEGVAEIDAARRADAHSELARWMAGDRRTNNDLRGRSHLSRGLSGHRRTSTVTPPACRPCEGPAK